MALLGDAEKNMLSHLSTSDTYVSTNPCDKVKLKRQCCKALDP